MKRISIASLVAAAAMLAIAAAPALADEHDVDGGTDVEAGAEQEEEQAQRSPARLRLNLSGNRGGGVAFGNRLRLRGALNPLVEGERIRLRLMRNGKPVRSTRVKAVRPRSADDGRGVFRVRTPPLIRPGTYRFVARKPGTEAQREASARTRNVEVRYPDLRPGQTSDAVRIMTRLLRQKGYHVPRTRSYNAAVERAVIAYHKVTRRARTANISPRGLRDLAAGKGGFRLRHPGSGRHVEVDVTRQVMVLANNGRPQHIFHVSTGKPATPSDLGHFRFFRYEPGLNNVNMYYSVYYNGGEATHGYRSVPTYPASAGCIRNPMANSIFIYRWINLGMSIYVYR